MTMRKLSATEEHLIEIQTKLTKWNSFVREVPVPADILPAITTGRLELLKLAQPRALNAEECAVLYQLIGGLLETNQALQQHTALIAELAKQVADGIGGAAAHATRMQAYSNYRQPMEDEEDA